MLIKVESMSKAMSLKFLRLKGAVMPWVTRPGEISTEFMVKVLLLI
jgi:hypothetical protein